jgi:hypothetical protein
MFQTNYFAARTWAGHVFVLCMAVAFWITQSKSFAGSGGTVGYLPAAQLTISVVATYTPEAFDNKGDSPNASQTIFASLADALAPHTLPSQ